MSHINSKEKTDKKRQPWKFGNFIFFSDFQSPLFYSGIHLALQKGTMIYLDFLESTP